MEQAKIIASAEAENTGGIYKTELRIDQHVLITDEPIGVGGKDEGPAPGSLLCMSLASCKVITLRMYAQRKGWNLTSIKIKVSLVKGADTTTGNNTFYCQIFLNGDITAEQKTRLMEIAKACPIQKLLEKPSDIISTLVEE